MRVVLEARDSSERVKFEEFWLLTQWHKLLARRLFFRDNIRITYLLLTFDNVHLMNIGDIETQLKNYQLQSLRTREPAVGIKC